MQPLTIAALSFAVGWLMLVGGVLLVLGDGFALIVASLPFLVFGALVLDGYYRKLRQEPATDDGVILGAEQ